MECAKGAEQTSRLQLEAQAKQLSAMEEMTKQQREPTSKILLKTRAHARETEERLKAEHEQLLVEMTKELETALEREEGFKKYQPGI